MADITVTDGDTVRIDHILRNVGDVVYDDDVGLDKTSVTGDYSATVEPGNATESELYSLGNALFYDTTGDSGTTVTVAVETADGASDSIDIDVQ